MAISTGLNQLMDYQNYPQDVYIREKMRAMEEAQYEAMKRQMNAFNGLSSQQGLQNAIQPVPNPEPNKVLLLLE